GQSSRLVSGRSSVRTRPPAPTTPTSSSAGPLVAWGWSHIHRPGQRWFTGIIDNVKRKSLLTLIGAGAGTTLAAAGIPLGFVGTGGGAAGGRDSATPTASQTQSATSPASPRAIPRARRFSTSAQVAVALLSHGVQGCSFDRIRTECRYADGRYVAATVITED